jgi:hypothetical protein
MIEDTIVIVVLILLIFYFYRLNTKSDVAGFCPDVAEQSVESFDVDNGFSDFTDYSQPVEMEPQRTRYNSRPAWDDFHNKILTIVGGDSIRKFEIGRKFRLVSVKRDRDGNLSNGMGSTNQPFIYIETSSNGIDWELHPQYSTPGDSISFEGYDVFNLDSPGGMLKFVRYPNGRLFIGNEYGEGDLHTLELTNLKSIVQELPREPGLNSRYDSSDPDDTPSALSSKNSIL